MRKTSKFSFPIPGRKHAPSEESPSAKHAGTRNTSKAQRLLGTESDLNIDSRGAYRSDDEVSWKYPASSSSFMSIAISESTNSGHSGIDSRNGGPLLEPDSGPRLNGKASSTLLGKRFGGDELTTSDSTDRLRREGSSSTLKSFYDRQKSPLAISQQTSDSSARDLALRKGLPRVVPVSPLLKVETFVDTHGDMLDTSFNGEEDAIPGLSAGRGARKKPARLDFSLLVPKSMRNGERSASTNPSPSSTSTSMSRPTGLHHPDSARRRLAKMLSRESMSVPNQIADSEPSLRSRESNNSLSQLYDHYEQLPIRSPLLVLGPGSQAAERRVTRTTEQEPEFDLPGIRKEDDSYISPSEPGPVWQSFRWNVEDLPPEEKSSATSVSSRNTKTSRHTSTSALSQVNLREKSVLSLSSDSEEEDFELPLKTPDRSEERALDVMSRASESPESPNKSKRKHTRQKATSITKSPHRKGAMQETPFLTIPEIPTNLRLSGPWSPPMMSPRMSPRKKSSRSSLPNRRSSVGQGERRSVRTSSSVASFRTGREGSLQPTPPLSPTSMEFRQSSEFSSRFMAVTKQEEALLEALRQKKARMREKIIEEHEFSTRSPPQIPTRTSSVATSVTTDSGDSNGKQRVLLYLDTPLSQHHHIDTAEPSPDLSDFLTFGSDEESTPRTSLVTNQKELPRPDSTISPRSPRLQDSKHLGAPPSTGPRISAVGPSSGFVHEAQTSQAVKQESRVKLMEDVNGGAEFLLDDNDRVWGIH